MNITKAKSIIESDLNCKIRKIVDSSKGWDHKVFIASTNKGKFVLRYAKEDKNKIWVQKEVCDLWRKKGIKAPKTIFFAKEYLIEECIIGKSVEDTKLTKKELKNLFKELGTVLRKMHSIKEKGFGELVNARIGRHKTWTSYTDDILYSNLKEGMKKKRFSKDITTQIKKIYTNFKPYLKTVNKPVLLHGDFGPSNMMVYKKKFSGAIDAADAQCGDPLYDLGVMYYDFWDQDLFKELFKTYGKQDMKTIKFYTLLALAWIIPLQKTKKDLRNDLKKLNTLIEELSQ